MEFQLLICHCNERGRMPLRINIDMSSGSTSSSSDSGVDGSSGDFTMIDISATENPTNLSYLSSEGKESTHTSGSEMSSNLSMSWHINSKPKLNSPPNQILITSPPPPNSITTNLLYKTKSLCIRAFRLLYSLLNAAILIGVLCSLFLAEILVAVLYRNEIVCSSTIMTIFNWLIWDAVVGIVWYYFEL